MKIKVLKKQLTRTDLVNPGGNVPLRKRLRKAKAIDLRGNHHEEVLPSGYTKIVIHDRSKTLC